MSKTPPWNVDTDAYLADTHHLRGSTHHGAYLLILMAMWRSADGFLPNDDAFLARAAHMTLDKWRRVAPIIRPLLHATAAGITQKRIRRDKVAANHPDGRPSQNPSRNPGKGSKPLESIGADSREGGGPESASSLNLTSTDSETLKKENKKEAGIKIPDDWKPSDKARLYGRTVLKLSDDDIDAEAESMRRWAVANSHRKEARKVGRHGWDLTFENWLKRNKGAARGTGRQGGRPTEGRSASALALELARRARDERS